MFSKVSSECSSKGCHHKRQKRTHHPYLKRAPLVTSWTTCYFKDIINNFKALNNLAPTYLSELVKQYVPSRNLRSSNTSLKTMVTEPSHPQSLLCGTGYPRIWKWNSRNVELFSAFILHLDDISSWKCKSPQLERKKISTKDSMIRTHDLDGLVYYANH